MSDNGYSAKVRLWLEIGEAQVGLGNVGPSWCMTAINNKDCGIHQKGPATLCIQVDENLERIAVELLNDITGERHQEVRYRKLQERAR
jgi:hypothetical protein